MNKISIITVAWNAASDLDFTLSNLTALDYPTLELIVIDGGSTDSTSEVIQKHKASITYSISEPDKGVYDAMNKGILAATGDYIWFINAGDKVFSRDVLLNIFSSDESADIYFGETAVATADGQIKGLLKKKPPLKLTWRSLLRGMVVCHQSFIVRREIAPLYDLQYKYVADIDWAIKCLKTAKSIVNTNTILSQFAQGGISTKHRKESLGERWRVMCLHYGLFATILAHLIFIVEAPFRKKYRKIVR